MRSDPLLGHLDLKIIGTYLNAAQRYERQVTADEALFDGSELRLISFDIDVNILQLADLLAVTVDERPTVPFGDVPSGLARTLFLTLVVNASHLNLPVCDQIASG